MSAITTPAREPAGSFLALPSTQHESKTRPDNADRPRFAEKFAPAFGPEDITARSIFWCVLFCVIFTVPLPTQD